MGLFNPGKPYKDAADVAKNYYNQGQDQYNQAQNANQDYYNQGQGMRQPWINQGQQVGTQLQGMLGKLMNPEELQSEWTKGYQQSPYAQQMLQQNQASGLDAASSMGLMGSSGALGNIQQGAGNIVNADRHEYLNDLMNKYMQAIGLGQNMYNTGAQMAGQGAQGAQNQGQFGVQSALQNAGIMNQFGENQANMKYNQGAAGGNMMGGLLGGAAGLFGSALGGPIGGALGNWFGNKFGGGH